RVSQGVLDEHRIALERAVRSKLVDIEFVLPLDRHKDPWLRGMEIEMPRSEAVSGSRRDRGKVAQRAAIECKDLERAGIFRLAVGGVVAACDQDCGAVSRRRADLMPIDAGIELVGLAYRFTDRAIAIDVVHRDVARVVVAGEQIFAGRVDAGVDRTRRQRLWLAMGLQRTRAGVDAEGVGAVRGAGKARAAVAR